MFINTTTISLFSQSTQEVPTELHQRNADIEPEEEALSKDGPSQLEKEEALENLEESFKILKQMVQSTDADSDTMKGIASFRKRLGKISKRQTVSALHKFGTVAYLKKLQPKVKSIVKRAERQNIGVQPTSIQRRRMKNGSKRKVLTGSQFCQTSMCPIPDPTRGKRKRKHQLGTNIADNVNSAKKHEVTMKSVSRPTFPKKK